jgi:hypothetical protein
MTDLLEKALVETRKLPNDMQDAVASIMLGLAGKKQPIVQLTPAQEASLAGSLELAARREFATNEQVRAVWAKYGL